MRYYILGQVSVSNTEAILDVIEREVQETEDLIIEEIKAYGVIPCALTDYIPDNDRGPRPGGYFIYDKTI